MMPEYTSEELEDLIDKSDFNECLYYFKGIGNLLLPVAAIIGSGMTFSYSQDQNASIMSYIIPITFIAASLYSLTPSYINGIRSDFKKSMEESNKIYQYQKELRLLNDDEIL